MTRWRTPTRRTFFALLGTGVAALAVRKLPALAAAVPEPAEPAEPAPAPETAISRTRLLWIGHC